MYPASKSVAICCSPRSDGYVEAMGGKLSLVVEFPDRPPIALTGIATLDKEVLPAKLQ